MAGIIFILILCMIIIYMTHVKKNEGYEAFVINKNEHYSLRVNRTLPIKYKFVLCSKSINFSAIFSDGCNYDTDSLGKDSLDVNKLYGISYGFDHRYRSIRIGWNYNSNLGVIQLFTYSYIQGQRKIQLLSRVKLYSEITISINWHKDGSIVQVRDFNRVIGENTIVGVSKSWIQFKLFPYFGGNQKAPNDMKIFIKDI